MYSEDFAPRRIREKHLALRFMRQSFHIMATCADEIRMLAEETITVASSDVGSGGIAH